MESLRDCASSSKLCFPAVSWWRSSASWVSALLRRSSSTSMMPSLFCLYTSGAGAPKSSSVSSEAPCTIATRRFLSLLPRDAASMTALSVFTISWTSLVFTCACTRAELRILRSRTLMARSSELMTSRSSASAAWNSADSLPRISVAAFRSASSCAMEPERSSIFVCCEEMSEMAFSLVAVRSSISAFRVLISNPIWVRPSSHHSTYAL
mmetsp:Transcript_16158/g.42733  ORF Transcript_16158/g.42733 Transcript_16158/m.42733 type:complete len:209 (-) Transcript_16158:224-850(-)